MGKIEKRKSISLNESSYSYITSSKDNGNFLEITEWTNGEGFDIVINEKIISLHRDEIEAINAMIWCLDHDLNLEENVKN